MVTIKEIAEQMHVSPTTVANVIHGRTSKVSKENVKRIQDALREHNYVSKMGLEALTKGKSKLIAIIIHVRKQFDNTLLGDPFFGSTISVLEHQIRSRGYFTMLYVDSDIDNSFKMAMSWNVAGIVCITHSVKNYMKLRSLVECPVVGIDTYNDDSTLLECGGYHVTINDIQAGYEVGEYLIRKGFKNIIAFSDDKSGASSLRAIGLKKAMEDHHLPLPAYWHILVDDNKRNRFHQIQSLFHFVNKDYVLFCSSDQLAFEVISNLTERHCQIPQELSIVGFDDNSFANFCHPKLTTVNQDIEAKSIKAASILFELIENKPVEEGVVYLPFRIVERDSVVVPK